MYMIQSQNTYTRDNRWTALGHLARLHQCYFVLVALMSNQLYGALLPALGIRTENDRVEAAGH
jgi:hypothetical protein